MLRGGWRLCKVPSASFVSDCLGTAHQRIKHASAAVSVFQSTLLGSAGSESVSFHPQLRYTTEAHRHTQTRPTATPMPIVGERSSFGREELPERAMRSFSGWPIPDCMPAAIELRSLSAISSSRDSRMFCEHHHHLSVSLTSRILDNVYLERPHVVCRTFESARLLADVVGHPGAS
ncbi:hypothetical protein HPB50_020380 [Hyalomma asiaticum]|uniref:Uncharacterized protein n=1 Tax=Hyalomma asiaticum TaxID=266040 RepID=A0ACB7SRI9_HYAAI|nr:hypothetical protein HPB50_020380 [Hyalomma asiaticum]